MTNASFGKEVFLRTGIYAIVNTTNGKQYIGSAVDFSRRWSYHRFLLRKGRHHSRHLQASWDKHGADAFSFRRLIICSKESLLMYEQAALDCFAPEFNVCKVAGSALGCRHSEETKLKISAANIGNRSMLGMRHRPETIAKIAASRIGNTATKGKRRNPEAVAKTAAAHRGMKRSEETRAKIAEKARGRVWSEEAKAKLSLTLTGRKMSPEARAKLIGNTRARKNKVIGSPS